MASPRLLVLLDGGKVGIPNKGNEVRKKNSVLRRHQVDVHNLRVLLALEMELVNKSFFWGFFAQINLDLRYRPDLPVGKQGIPVACPH